MAKKRLNDTSAIVNQHMPSEAHHSISTRKIDNGWLIEQSTHNPQTGHYSSSTSFSPNAPRIIPGRAARSGVSPDSGSSLRRCMDYMKDE